MNLVSPYLAHNSVFFYEMKYILSDIFHCLQFPYNEIQHALHLRNKYVAIGNVLTLQDTSVHNLGANNESAEVFCIIKPGRQWSNG